MTATGKWYPYQRVIAETRAYLNHAWVITWQHDTRGPRKHHEWQQFTTTIKESSRTHLTLVHIFHAYASVDTLWTAHAQSRVSPMRYCRVSSNWATVEASKFAGPHKISYVSVHNSNLLIGARQSVLNRHRRGLPPWSSEFQIRAIILLSIYYSSISPQLPLTVSSYANHSIILLNHIGSPSIERDLSRVDSNHSSSTDSLHN
jgi:hypothetical protein